MPTETSPTTFHEATTLAQTEHQLGNFAQAVEIWQQARRLADNDFEDAQSLRGEASSTFRRGGTDDAYRARVIATGALIIHERLARDQPNNIEAVRQVPESVRVLGRIELLPLLAYERETGRVQAQRLHGIRMLFKNRGDPPIGRLMLHRGREGLPDQHEINYWPTRAAVEAFAPSGDPRRARRYARQALRLASQSEEDALPSAAHISAEHSRRAQLAAHSRAHAARAITSLVTTEMSLRRKGALWIATRDRLM
ncbi:MAG TPA: hypothetical protein VJP80_02800 [Candidatus Saccharimonadales bacterium]|nr:hypothetical protein [Candidatus Saccharimonadales bacterium]